ncbi:hypothetical protein [Reichenbachiella agariperforans]|nr:hypothetical protein [Reichenbachiella agariperforans]
MNIIRSWREIKIMLKWKFSTLNDADFEYEEGYKDNMLDRLAQKLNTSRTELEGMITELQNH